MIVYNVTSKVDASINSQWLKWTKEVHVPDLIKTGCFTHATILHLLEADDDQGMTYAVQYHSPSIELYQEYLEEYADAMRRKARDKWGENVVSFRTVMEEK